MLRAALGIGASLATVSARLGVGTAIVSIFNIAVFSAFMWWRLQGPIQADVSLPKAADDADSVAKAATHVDQGAPTSAMVFFAGFGLVLLLVRAAYRCVNQDESTPSTQVVRRAPIMSARPKALLEPVT